MYKLNKLGFSSILQVTILSALSVVSLMLIWGYVKDLSSDFNNQLSPVADCISQKSKVSNVCLNSDGQVEVSFSLGLQEKINSIDLNLNGKSFSCGNSCSSCNFEQNQNKKTIYLNSNNVLTSQDKLVVSINRCTPEEFIVLNC